MKKVKNLIKNNYSIVSTLGIFILSIVLIAPWGNYAVNDDWQFLTHVRYFSEDNFKKNPLIDASFILQGFIGMYWGELFGISFTSLRVLTIIFTIFFLFGIYKILNYHKINQKIILLAFFCILIEPFVLTSSLSFMTEIYFLTFMIWSLYFFIRFLDKKKFGHSFILAVLIGSLSILIRQFGVVLLIGYLITIFWVLKFNKKSIFLALVTFFFFLSTIFYNLNFPQYSGVYDSKEEKLLNLFANYNDLGEKLVMYLKFVPYVIFFLSPILIIFIKKKYSKYIFFLSIPLAYLIFSIDIFDLRNVFHLECFYCESNYYHEHSIFNNIFFKFLISYFISYILINTLFYIYENKFINSFKKLEVSSSNFVISILAIGMFLIILAVDSFYDRYFVNFSILLIILIALNIKNTFFKLMYSVIIFSTFYLYILFLNFEFHNSTYYKWKQGIEINKATGLKAQILLSGAFSRYLNAIEKAPEDLIRPVKFGVQKCYVIRHVQESDNFIIKFLELKVFNNKYINNPVFSNVSNINELPKSRDYLKNSIFVDEYFSPMFNLLGQRTYIVSYCLEEVTNRYNINTTDNLKIK
jgi:hypothetical protein